MKKSLIYIDKGNPKNSIDLIEVANLIYNNEPYETYGVLINNESCEGEGLFDKLISISECSIFEEDPMVVTDIMEELYQTFNFDSILIPATAFGRMLAPRLAMRIHTGLVADVTDINVKDNVLEMIRPAFSGKIMAAITKKGNGPIMMSIRQNVFRYKPEGIKNTKKLDFLPKNIRQSSLKLLEVKEKLQSYDISDSEVLISGGGGVIKDFYKLQSLADELNAQVSASRKIIDKGIAQRNIQVGQSGKTVNPKLYIALGINGAIQHIEGLKNVENIISVNLNRNAPICYISDMVIEGDASEFIDKILLKIRANK